MRLESRLHEGETNQSYTTLGGSDQGRGRVAGLIMPTLRQVNKLFVRAALIWALASGLLLAARATVDLGSEVVELPQAVQAGEAAVAALIFGFFGNLWLSTVYSLAASLPASRPVPLKHAPYVAPVWQVGAVTAVASSFPFYAELPGSRYPLLALAAVAGYVTYVSLQSIRTRATDPSATHWTNLVACVELFFGSLLAILGSVGVVGADTAAVGLVFVALGWSPHAALVLFTQAFDLEPYDDQRPVYFAFGAALAALVAVFLGQGGMLLASLAQLAYVLALAFLLQKRWFGRFVSWEERFLMAGVVAGFLGLAGAAAPQTSVLLGFDPAGDSFPILASGVAVVPLAFGAAYVARQRPKFLKDGLCKVVVVAIVAAVLPQFLFSLFYLNPSQRYGSFVVRGAFGAAEAVVALGLVALASLVRGIGRPRADLRPV